MKLLPAICVLLFTQVCYSQSLDYISVRKKNGKLIKNFYVGSDIAIQTIDGSFLQGPISSIRNDSVFITLYDIRYFPTTFGSYFRDTIAVTVAGIKRQDIKRVLITTRSNFLQRTVAPLAMIGGAGFFTLNILNGAFSDYSITDSRNLKRLGIAAGAFGLGYLFRKVFSNDGFSKKNHRIVYVDL
jgi:hypothetical protein